MLQVTTPEELGLAIRAARTSVGLSQSALAARLGVSRITIGRLERGEDVSMTTALAALRTCGMGLSPVETRGWMTAREHAQAIGRELDREDPSFALNLLRQALEDLDYLTARGDAEGVDTFFSREPKIDDARWEHFLKLALLERCPERIERPAWSELGTLPEPFFPTRPSRRFIARTIARTSAAFAQANVWIDERDLAYA